MPLRALSIRVPRAAGRCTLADMNDFAPPPEPGKHVSSEFDAFQRLTRRPLAVPKAEIDAREVEYQRQQCKKPKRGPKPGPEKDS